MKTPVGYVALRKGRNNIRNCIFLNWCDAEQHIIDFDAAEYSVIDTIQDAEKYIIVGKNPDGCSTIERTVCTVNALVNQSPWFGNTEDQTNTNTGITATTTAPSPPPLPLATLDDIDNDNNINACNNNNDNNNTICPNNKSSCVENTEFQTDSLNMNNTTTTIAAAPSPPPLPPAAIDDEIDNDNKINTSYASTMDACNSDVNDDNNDGIVQQLQLKVLTGPSPSFDSQNQITTAAEVITTTQSIPVKSVVGQNESNNGNQSTSIILNESDKNDKVTNIAAESIPKTMINNPSGATKTTAASKTSTKITTKTRSPRKDTTRRYKKSKKIGRLWINSFEEFVSYRKSKRKYPKKPIPRSLKYWRDYQNKEFKKKVQGLPNTMSDEKEELLRNIGFVFSIDQQIKEGVIVPVPPPVQVYDEEKQQEKENQQKKVSTKRFQNWKDNLIQLKQYMEAHDGDWNVKKKDDLKLYSWLCSQRTQYLLMKEGKQSTMNEEKLLLLRDIGVDLDKVVHSWSERIEQLKYFKEENGHMNIPHDHPVLGVWVQNMIDEHKQMLAGKPVKELNSKKIDELQTAGVIEFLNVVQPNSQWNEEFEKMIVQLKEYNDKHGTCCVKRNTKQECNDLYNWCKKVKSEYRRLSDEETASKCRLSTRQIARLTEIGFELKRQARCKFVPFEERIEQLKEFKRNGGDVGTISNSHPQFGTFIRHQRLAYRLYCQGKTNCNGMNEKRIQILTDLGMLWNVEKWKDPDYKSNEISYTWDERFQHLIDYKAKHGHVIVPKKTTNGLGHWVKHQRYYYKIWQKEQQQQGNNSNKTTSKSTRMNAEKALKLSSIGFVFDVKSYKKSSKEKKEKE